MLSGLDDENDRCGPGADMNGRFDSPQEEAAHYREKYRRILDMLDETRAELGQLPLAGQIIRVVS